MEINSYVERKKELRKQIITLLRKNGIMTKVQLHNITGAGYTTLDKILEKLMNEKRVLIIKYESFGNNDRVVTHSTDIKLIKPKKNQNDK